MIWYRGDNRGTGGRWYARSVEYAEFFGAVTTSIEVPAEALLDLRHLGIGDEDTVVDEPGMPEYHDIEMYAYAERQDVQAAARALGYRGIRVMQWHADYSGEPEDTMYYLED